MPFLDMLEEFEYHHAFYNEHTFFIRIDPNQYADRWCFPHY